ncbi:hypothetical protein ACFUJU_35905 [Streptomyces sp. NPDC057235]|uniref:hypothetical protein n=1 Tax=Streptomyces sp. NPDC057235 TaxID=3346058 RepID=UPI003624B481
MSHHADYAEMRAERADDASIDSDNSVAKALGSGLSAIAYALLEVASAIRENTQSRR